MQIAVDQLKTIALCLFLTSPDGSILRSSGKTSTRFSIKKWASLLEKSVGDSIMVSVSGLYDEKWKAFDSFGRTVSTADEYVEYGVDPRKTASILDIFTCIMQGLIPYGAQFLLVASLSEGRVSPGDVIPNNWYLFLLAGFAILSYFVPWYEKITLKDQK